MPVPALFTDAVRSTTMKAGAWPGVEVARIPSPALPASISILLTVLIDTSHTRETERMDDPSHSIERIWTRVSVGNLFMGA